MGEESFVYTSCPGWGDHEYCALKTIVKDGRIVRCEHADYTGAEANEGYICQKGVAAARQPYNPDRIQGPLKRVGERGEGKWEQITWDQALDEIAEKMLDLRDKYGAETVSSWNLPASVPPTFGMHRLMNERFMNAWGGTDPVISYGIDNGPSFAGFYLFNNPAMFMLTSPFNFDDSKYLIVWGANPLENQQRVMNHLIEARTRGAKIVDVGLIYDGTAAWADEFVAVNPGSDAALALAMCNLIVENGWINGEYLLNDTTAPFLVRLDNGQFYQDEQGQRAVWDSAANAPVPMVDGEKECGAAQSALEGRFNIDGVEVQTVYEALKAHLAEYGLERATEITGVPAETIEHMAREYATAGPSYIIGALGLRYMQSGEAYRAFYSLAALTGQIGYPGAGVTSALMTTEYPAVLNDMPISHPFDGDPSKDKCVQVKTVDWFEGVRTGKYRALIKTSGNPLHNAPNRGRWVNEIIPKLDLIVDFDIWMTDTAEYADYVLPDCMPFEREELIMSACYGHIVLQEPAIEPAADCHNAVYLFSELAKRVGLGEYFQKTTEEWLAVRLETDYPAIAYADPPITLERLHKEKLVRMVIPEEPKFDPFLMPMPTRSARMELYSETLYHLGHALPEYEPPYEARGDRQPEYPFQFFTGRQRFFMQSMYTDDPLMIKMSGGHPTIRVNPAVAKEMDIEDGEEIEVYNDRGHMVAPARLDEAVPPKTIQAWFGWRHKHYRDGMYSELLMPLSGTEADQDPLARQWWEDYGIYGDGTMLTNTGSWDTTWDCACNIRKVAEKKEAQDGK